MFHFVMALLENASHLEPSWLLIPHAVSRYYYSRFPDAQGFERRGRDKAHPDQDAEHSEIKRLSADTIPLTS